MPRQPLHYLLKYFFRQLYHGFAWSYDLVAAIVSVGRWEAWVQTSEGFLQGPRVLEIGFGTGMLQQSILVKRRWLVAGVDESAQMAGIARKRLARAGLPADKLVRGVAQRLPYASSVLDNVVSTFPSEFIVDADSLAEIRRVLRPGGKLILVSAAWIVGRRLPDRGAAWLFKATHQAPGIPPDQVAGRFEARLEQAGFAASHREVEGDGSIVLVIIGSAQTGPHDAVRR